MADTRRRASERRYQQGGTPLEEQQWLRERLRSGDLQSERVHFAAYLGHEPAQRVLGLPDPKVPPLRRLKRVMRGGIRINTTVQHVDDEPLLRSWSLDCVERVLPLAVPNDDLLRRALLLSRNTDAEALQATELESLRETLGAMAASREESGWRSVRMALEEALGACARRWPAGYNATAIEAAARARANLRSVCKGAFEAAKNACEAVAECGEAAGRSADDEATWQAYRLVEYLLHGSVPALSEIPSRLTVPPPAPAPRLPLAAGIPIRCSPFVVAQVAALDRSLRDGVWHGLQMLLSNRPGAAVLPIEDPRGGGWWQLRVQPRRSLLAPASWLRRGGAEEAFLLFRQIGNDNLKLEQLSRWRWLEAEERVGLESTSLKFRDDQRGDEELPRPPVDAGSLMGRYAGLPYEVGISLEQLREAAEHLANVLERWEGMSEQERGRVLEAHPAEERKRNALAAKARRRAEAIPQLVQASAALLPGLSEARDGATLRGRCPRCQVESDLRIFAADRFVLCFRCYFDWW